MFYQLLRILNNREVISGIIGSEVEREIYTQGLINYQQFIESNFSWARVA